MRTNKTEKIFFLIKMKESFLLLNKEDINLSIPKKVNILYQAQTQTHTHKAHTHTHTRAFKICSVKLFLYSLNYKCVTIKTVFTQK